MTSGWTLVLFVVVGFYLVCSALDEIGRQTKRCAESLVNIEVTLVDVDKRLSGMDADLTAIRVQVAPGREPTDEHFSH
jgi:hypothetical protein